MIRHGYSPRTYRVVKLVIDGNHAWLVVSASLRDDDTWDVIHRAKTRIDAFEYVEEVVRRNRALVRVGALVVE